LENAQRTLIAKDIGPPVRLLVKQLPKEPLPQPWRNQDMVVPVRQRKIVCQALENAQMNHERKVKLVVLCMAWGMLENALLDWNVNVLEYVQTPMSRMLQARV